MRSLRLASTFRTSATMRFLWAPGVNPYLTPEVKADELAALKQENEKLRPNGQKTVVQFFSSYADCKSETNDVDVHETSPRFYCPDPAYSQLEFVDISLGKQSCEKAVKDIVASGATKHLPADPCNKDVHTVADETTKKPDVFLNLCDGGFYEPRTGLGVARALDQEGAAWAGSPAWCFETSKTDMKLLLAGNERVFCPGAASLEMDLLDSTAADGDTIAIANNLAALRPQVAHLNFPVLIKPPAGMASIGMKSSSKCDSLEALEKELRGLAATAKQGTASDVAGIGSSTMVEEFIAGGEATVLVTEKGVHGEFHAFPPVAFDLPDPNSFFHFDFKWDQNIVLSARAKKMDPTSAIYKQLQAASIEAFKVIMGGQSYGRCDFRISAKDGKPYFLEINPACGLMYPWDAEDPNGVGERRESEKHWMHGDLADMAIIMDPNYSHLDFCRWHIEAAERRQMETKPWWFNKKGSETSGGSAECRATRAVGTGMPLFGSISTPAGCTQFTSANGRTLVGRCDAIMSLEMARLTNASGATEGNIGWCQHPFTGARYLGAVVDISPGTKLVLAA